jgi:general secretion pathway protein G
MRHKQFNLFGVMNDQPKPETKPRVFRCAYCHNIMGTEIHPVCKHCGKTAIVPDKFQKVPYSLRRKLRDRRWRQARVENFARENKIVGVFNEKKRSIYMTIRIVFYITGIMLLARSCSTPIPTEKVQLSKQQIAAEDMAVLTIALDRFKADCGRYPSTTENLVALQVNPDLKEWKGPYLYSFTSDPWKSMYQYIFDTNGFLLFSNGPDRKPQTEDDVKPAPTNSINISSVTMKPSSGEE